MKSIRPALIFSLITLLATLAASAQRTPAQPARTTTPAPKTTTAPTTTSVPAAAGTRIGLIDSGAFDAKDGLTRYTSAQDAVEASFATELKEFNTLGERINSLQAEITRIQQQLQATPDPKVPVNLDQLRATGNAKAEEYERLEREYKFRQEDIKVRYQKKNQELVGPVMKDISDALQEFAKAKGFSIIFNTSKLFENGYLLAVGDFGAVDATKDFIAFFNARTPKPATAK